MCENMHALMQVNRAHACCDAYLFVHDDQVEEQRRCFDELTMDTCRSLGRQAGSQVVRVHGRGRQQQLNKQEEARHSMKELSSDQSLITMHHACSVLV